MMNSERFHHLPVTSVLGQDSSLVAELHALCQQEDTPPEVSLLLQQAPASLWCAIEEHSPYLHQLIRRHTLWAAHWLERGATYCMQQLLAPLFAPLPASRDALMKELRLAKQQGALVIALADITHEWGAPEVTTALTELAERCLQRALLWLCEQQYRHGQWQRSEEAMPSDIALPRATPGVIVLGMGKMGAHELNYSSDIDVVLFYTPDVPAIDPERLHQQMQRMGQELVDVMQSRTADGYVFRTDTRLRPDPGSTPVWMKAAAGLHYYETVGQNWERCAYIKARPVAGDMKAGADFLQAMHPYIWRKYLDFTAIADIESIRRQIDSRQRRLTPSLYGHNIKLGVGGIRDIEFFVQTQQLIWGGRIPELQRRETVYGLQALEAERFITPEQSRCLQQAYTELRRAEHALQMMRDEQTHSLPEEEEGFAHFAGLLGFVDTTTCRAWLHQILETVQTHARGSTHATAPLSATLELDAEQGERLNLVFTGVEDDPDTIHTLRRLGYQAPSDIASAVRDWHRGKRRATRTTQSRALLTEAMPALLQSLAKTPQPDETFRRFDRLLQNTPSGIQLVSLLYQRPDFLARVTSLLSAATAMAETLINSPHLLERLLAMVEHPTPATALASDLQHRLEGLLPQARDREEALHLIRQHHAEARYQAGVEILAGRLSLAQSGECFTRIADIAVQHVLNIEYQSFAEQFGEPEGGCFWIAACGKMGNGQMTFTSDLDLVFLYEATGQGTAKFMPETYYNRLAQRVVTGLSALMRYGRLYEVDVRLRPFGKDGPMASRSKALMGYLAENAWVYEHMAYLAFRVVASTAPEVATDGLRQQVLQAIAEGRQRYVLTRAWDELWEKITTHLPPAHGWDVKYQPGGLLYLEMLLQRVILSLPNASFVTVPCAPVIWPETLWKQEYLPADLAELFTSSLRVFYAVQQILRLSETGDSAPQHLTEDFLRLLQQSLAGDSVVQMENSLWTIYKTIWSESKKLL